MTRKYGNNDICLEDQKCDDTFKALLFLNIAYKFKL